ncbi:biogenesis AIM24 [Streptomyces sp. DfronAA-171]|nr:biogenesis AIM24 [Streptomyces sp. DfronAA-171]
MTSGTPLLLEVTGQNYVNVDSDAVVAWSTSLRVQMQSQTQSSGVFRRRGSTGEGWELSFLGQGHVLVQPSEMLPPQNTDVAGPRGHYGVGQNQGNAWE